MPFPDWLNSKDGVIHKELLKRSGLDVDNLMREWEIDQFRREGVGEGMQGNAQQDADRMLEQADVEVQEAEQQRMNRGQPSIIPTAEWKPTNDDGSINPIPFKIDDENSVNFQPHQTMEVKLTGENDKDMIQLENAYEAWRATMFDQIMTGTPLHEMRDEAGRSYALGTMWQGLDLDEETNKIIPKTFMITPETIQSLLNDKLSGPNKNKVIADKMKQLEVDFRELYGIPWEEAYGQLKKDMHRNQQVELDRNEIEQGVRDFNQKRMAERDDFEVRVRKLDTQTIRESIERLKSELEVHHNDPRFGMSEEELPSVLMQIDIFKKVIQDRLRRGEIGLDEMPEVRHPRDY